VILRRGWRRGRLERARAWRGHRACAWKRDRPGVRAAQPCWNGIGEVSDERQVQFLEAPAADREGGGGAAAVHRRPGGGVPFHRLLGHDQELLGQVDPAAERCRPRARRRPGVLLPHAPQRGARQLRAQRRRAQVPDLRHAALDPQEGGEGGAAAGGDGPRPAHARADSTGRRQDRGGGESAGFQADDDGGLLDVRREPALARRRPCARVRREALRGQDLRHGARGRAAGGDLQPRAVQHGSGVAHRAGSGRLRGPGVGRPQSPAPARRERRGDRRARPLEEGPAPAGDPLAAVGPRD